MSEEKFEKTLKDIKWFSIIILVLTMIVFIYNVSRSALNMFQIVSYIIEVLLFVGIIISCYKKTIYAPILGIVVSILMIIALDIIDIILGIALLLKCISLMKYMKKE